MLEGHVRTGNEIYQQKLLCFESLDRNHGFRRALIDLNAPVFPAIKKPA